ncbi:MAG: hypothetical protein U5K69_02585 [Balneolaceae bacterium]|nr:hypothetical protein [Balneolaceae bacterium]
MLTRIHPIADYYHELQKLIGMPTDVKARRFYRLRTSMDFRNEYAYIEVPQKVLIRFPILKKLGVNSSDS